MTVGLIIELSLICCTSNVQSNEERHRQMSQMSGGAAQVADGGLAAHGGVGRTHPPIKERSKKGLN